MQYQIFLFIRQRKDLLKSCTIVCKEWERVLTPHLFETFNIAFGDYHHRPTSPTDIAGRLAKAPERVTKSFTTIRVQRGFKLSIPLLVSVLAYLPNVHTLHLFDTTLVASFGDAAFNLPSKFSLRSLTIIQGSMFTRDYDLFIALLGCFDRIDSIRLEAHKLLPPWLPGAWPSLPKVKNLSVARMSCRENLSRLLRMVQQPGFSEHLVSLYLDRCLCKWESLASVADILRAVKGTIQTFRFFPMFRYGESRPKVHDAAAMEQIGECALMLLMRSRAF